MLNKRGFDLKKSNKILIDIYNNHKNNNFISSNDSSFFSPIFFEKDIIGALYVEKLAPA